MTYIKTYKFEELPMTKNGEHDISGYVEIKVYEKESLVLENDQLSGNVVDSFFVKENHYFSNNELFGVKIDTDDVNRIIPKDTIGIFQKTNSPKNKGVGFFKLSANKYLIKHYQNTTEGTLIHDTSYRTNQHLSNLNFLLNAQECILGDSTKLYKEGSYLTSINSSDVIVECLNYLSQQENQKDKDKITNVFLNLITHADYADEDKLKNFIEETKEKYGIK